MDSVIQMDRLESAKDTHTHIAFCHILRPGQVWSAQVAK
jgi:hypothetical protein